MSQLSYKEIIESQLPKDLFKSKDIESQAIGNLLDKVQNDVDSLEKEVNPLSAVSKGLEQWERFFKLPSNVKDSIEIRKVRVVAELIQFMSDENVIRKDEMEAILSFFGQIQIVEYFAEYMFDVIFRDAETLNIDEIIKVIEKVKPTWLDYRLTSQHNTTLELITDSKEYEVLYPICGTYLCGTYPSIAVEGIQSGTSLNLDTQDINAVHHYPLTGEAITKE